MTIHAFDIKVEAVREFDTFVTISIESGENNIELFFNNLWDARDFARKISKLTEKTGLEKEWK